MFGRRRTVYPAGLLPDPPKWVISKRIFERKVSNLLDVYGRWRYVIPHDPVLDIICLCILARRKLQQDCLDADKLHQKWGNHTPLSLSRMDTTILYAETRIFPHDPLYGSMAARHAAGFERIFRHERYYSSVEARDAAGLARTLELLRVAQLRHMFRQRWNGAKPSHAGPHSFPECCTRYPEGGPGRQCSAFDPDYWKKHPEEAGIDFAALYDARLEAEFVNEFGEPGNPVLLPGSAVVV